jgi:hypothetical protein
MSLSSDELKKLKALPIMKELKKAYDSQQGSGRKMKGGNFWERVGSWFKQAAVDVDSWAKRVKPLTTLSKATGLLGLIPGLQELVPIAAGIKGAAEFTGYGKRRHGGRKIPITPNSIGQHITRNFVMQGMGTYVENHQSPNMRMLGGTFPSMMQPFLTTKRLSGKGVGQAIGSIGEATRIKF